MEKIKTWIDHNQFLAFMVFLSVLFCIYFVGCESKVASLQNPGEKVTRQQLYLEVEVMTQRLEEELRVLQAKASLSLAELDRLDSLKRRLLEFAAVTLNTGNLNYSGLLTLLLSLVGLGAVIDNRRKDTVIKTLKNNNVPVVEPKPPD